MKDLIIKEGVPCKAHILITGRAVSDDIIEFAKDHEVALIYIGIEKKSRLGKLVFGSNTQMIILEASCPVISVNEKAMINVNY